MHPTPCLSLKLGTYFITIVPPSQKDNLCLDISAAILTHLMKLQCSVLTLIANFLAICLVAGVIFQSLDNAGADEKAPVQPTVVVHPELVEVALPITTDRVYGRHLSKGKSSSSVDCVPLYPTPAPTKGKGGRAPPPLSTSGSGSKSGKNGKTKSTKGSSSQAPVSRWNSA